MSLWTSTVAPLLKGLDGPKPTFDEQRLRAVFHLAEQLYRGKEHWTGVPLLVHALGVAQMLEPFEPDQDTVIACLLQHALQTRQISLSDIEQQFGAVTRRLVSGVHLLSHIALKERRNSIEDLRVMLLSVSDDVRVILIILCERCYALDHLFLVSAEEKRLLSHDVLNLYAPVAARLGIHSLKERLEGLAFPVVYRADAEAVEEQLKQVQRHYGLFLTTVSQKLAKMLHEQGIAAAVTGREKRPFSIFNKMRQRAVSHIDQLTDLFGLRVIVDTEEQCYQTLGFLHRMGVPVPNRFKDYISFPKPNGYRSLHTTVSKLPGVPNGVFVEVQVRTHEMHREAEFGIAAHWSYKEGGSAEQTMRRVQLSQVLTQQQALEESDDKTAFADHIFVLTPKGDIVELPESATPLDFAFQIHTDLGIGFRAARVNGSIVPLDYELENGDIVEILTHRIPKPSSEWLQLLKMASSRSRLKRYLYALHRTDYVVRGKEMINEVLRRLHVVPLDNELSILRHYDGRTLPFSEREDLLMKIGQESETVGSLFAHVDALASVRSLLATPPKKSTQSKFNNALVEVEGGLPMPLRFAKCCNPDQGERAEIVGCITRGGEVMIHRSRCRMLKSVNPERRVKVLWSREKEQVRPVKKKKVPASR